MKQPKPFTRNQSVYMSTVSQLLNLGYDIANAVQGAKTVVREMKKL